MRSPIPGGLLPFLAFTGILTAACSGGGGGAPATNAAPTLVVTAPLSAVVVDVGQPVEIRWIADDPDDEALTSLTAVGLDVALALELVNAVPETDGVEQTFLWTPQTGHEGTYRIEAATTDGVRTTRASAPGTVGVGLVAPTAAGAATLCEGGTVLAGDSYPDGSFVVVGVFRRGDDAVFDAGGAAETRLTSETYDAFVARYGPDGAFLWARQTNALSLTDGQEDSLAYPWDVVALPGGGCVLDVAYQGTVTVGPGTPNEATWSAPLDRSRELLVGFDAAGGLSWSRPAYDADEFVETRTASLDLASDDTFVLTAERSGDVIFDLGGVNETLLSGDDGFAHLAGFEDDGSFLFATDLAYDPNGYVEQLRVHAEGRGVRVAGLFYGSVTFGLGSPQETTLTALAPDGYDQFLAYFDIVDGLRWARHVAGVSLPGEGDELPTAGLVADASGGAYVLSGPLEQGTYRFGLDGQQETSVTVQGDEHLLVLARHDAMGELAWLRTLRAGYLDGDEGLPGPVATATGGVAVAGSFEDYLEGDGFRLEQQQAPGTGSLFLARFGADGALEWALNDGGAESTVELASLCALVGDRLLLTGSVPGLVPALELGTNGTESTLLTGSGSAGLTFRAVFAGDGSF